MFSGISIARRTSTWKKNSENRLSSDILPESHPRPFILAFAVQKSGSSNG
jgi:hypothetical protein